MGIQYYQMLGQIVNGHLSDKLNQEMLFFKPLETTFYLFDLGFYFIS